MPTPTIESLQQAAQAWCNDETKSKEMDSDLAIAFAKILDDVKMVYVQKLAAISTAALGYHKKGDFCAEEFNSAALGDVQELYAKYEKLYEQVNS